MLGMLLFWGLALAAIVLIARHSGNSGYFESRYYALDILKERYAKGEIDQAEFEARRHAIAS